MYIVQVHILVKKEYIVDFIDATLANARNSINEPGIGKFDFLQDRENPARFILNEVYRTADDAAKHKETQHYKTWRDTVADFMAEPRKGILYTNLFPEEKDW